MTAIPDDEMFCEDLIIIKMRFHPDSLRQVLSTIGLSSLRRLKATVEDVEITPEMPARVLWVQYVNGATEDVSL